MSLAAIILAAGASRRMGSPKALLRLPGAGAETFLDRLIATMGSAAAPVIVVLGHGAEQIRGALARAGEAAFVVNPNWEAGQLSSLQCGLGAAPSAADGVLWAPVDQPLVAPGTVAALAGVFRLLRPPVAIPRYQGRRGHPVCCGREVVDELLALAPGGQARDVIHRHLGSAVYLDVDDPGVVEDIDDPAAYDRVLRAAGER